MNENKGYITKREENGSINISEEVIASIAGAAIQEVEGVAAMSGTEYSGKSRKNPGKNVKVHVLESGLKINCSILVRYGSVIADVAKKVQQAVSDAIENMTGISVESVNVHVGGVEFPKVEK